MNVWNWSRERRRPVVVVVGLVVAVTIGVFAVTFGPSWIGDGDSGRGPDQLLPSLDRHVDSSLGLEVPYPEGWGIQATGVPVEGVVLSILSPDGSVVVDVSRRFPPPKPPDIDDLTHLNGYAHAVFDMETLDSRDLEVTDQAVIELDDGSSAVTARFAVNGGSLTGDILVAIRPLGSEATVPFGDEAFVLRAIGPTEGYLPNASLVEAMFRGFLLTDRAGDAPLP